MSQSAKRWDAEMSQERIRRYILDLVAESAVMANDWNLPDLAADLIRLKAQYSAEDDDWVRH